MQSNEKKGEKLKKKKKKEIITLTRTNFFSFLIFNNCYASG